MTQKDNIFLLRTLASLIDLLILYLGFILYYKLVNYNSPMAYDRLFNGVFEIISYLPFCLVYGFIFEWATKGYTPGKFICRIRVKKLNGNKTGFLSALKRWLSSLVDFLLSLGLVAIISILFSSRHQRIGDRWAGTVVERT